MRELKTNTWPPWIVHVNPRYIHPIHSQQIPHFVNRQLTLIWMTYITFVQKFSDFSYALIGRELSGLCVNACMQQVTGRCLWSIDVQWHQESDTLYSGDIYCSYHILPPSDSRENGIYILVKTVKKTWWWRNLLILSTMFSIGSCTLSMKMTTPLFVKCYS